MNVEQLKKLRQRFVKDYNLPINIFSDPYFSHYLLIYDFFPRETWRNLVEKIENEYGGNVEAWLDYCGEVRDKAIDYVLNLDAYKEFNSQDISKCMLKAVAPERSAYNEETDGRRFVSIDIKKANFQTMKYLGIIKDETYEDFIGRFGGDDYIKNSKYLRQVIFGKMNPGRVIRMEKFLIGNIYCLIEKKMKECGFEIYSANSDELVFIEGEGNEHCVSEGFLNEIVKEVKENFTLDVRAEYIEVKRLPIVNSNGNKVDAYVRKNLITGEETLKKASTTFFPQIYKLWKGMKMGAIDRCFFFENQIAEFNDELRLDNNENISN